MSAAPPEGALLHLDRHVKRGSAVAFSMTRGNGIRLDYIDTTDHLPGMNSDW